jgi:hypothetical protein
MAHRDLGGTQSDSDMVPRPAKIDRGLEGCVLANVSTLRSQMPSSRVLTSLRMVGVLITFQIQIW